jgi:hypothetical protein
VAEGAEHIPAVNSPDYLHPTDSVAAAADPTAAVVAAAVVGERRIVGAEVGTRDYIDCVGAVRGYTPTTIVRSAVGG